MRASLRKTQCGSWKLRTMIFNEQLKSQLNSTHLPIKSHQIAFISSSRCTNAWRQVKNVEQKWNNRQNEPGLIVDIESIKTSALVGVAAECKQQRGGERPNKRKPRQHRSQYWSSQKQLQLVGIARLVRAGATHRPDSAALVEWVLNADKKRASKGGERSKKIYI